MRRRKNIYPIICGVVIALNSISLLIVALTVFGLLNGVAAPAQSSISSNSHSVGNGATWIAEPGHVTNIIEIFGLEIYNSDTGFTENGISIAEFLVLTKIFQILGASLFLIVKAIVGNSKKIKENPNEKTDKIRQQP